MLDAAEFLGVDMIAEAGYDAPGVQVEKLVVAGRRLKEPVADGDVLEVTLPYSLIPRRAHDGEVFLSLMPGALDHGTGKRTVGVFVLTPRTMLALMPLLPHHSCPCSARPSAAARVVASSHADQVPSSGSYLNPTLRSILNVASGICAGALARTVSFLAHTIGCR